MLWPEVEDWLEVAALRFLSSGWLTQRGFSGITPTASHAQRIFCEVNVNSRAGRRTLLILVVSIFLLFFSSSSMCSS